jgi:hypothetical protein
LGVFSILPHEPKTNTMQNKRFSILLVLALALSTTFVSAQAYKSSLGLAVDFGGGTLVGPGFKTFFSEKMASHVELGFTQGAVGITGLFQYHGSFPNAKGLKFIAGGGTTITLANGGGSAFFLRATSGLDYKIDKAPLALNFEWRPAFLLSAGGGMIPGRFGFGIRYVLK